MRQIRTHDGQVVMAIHVRIAMSRKVFGACHHAVVLHPFGILVTFGSDIIYIVAKTALVDNGVIRIIVDINRRRKIDMNAEATTFFSNRYTKLINELIVRNRTEHHLFGVGNGGTFQTHIQTPFGIHGNEKRYLADFLIVIRQF